MKRASATRSSVASGARQPRREALLRSGIALATAVALGVLGLLAGERSVDRPGAMDGAPGAEQAAPAAPRAQFAPALQSQPSVPATTPLGAQPAPAVAATAPASPPSPSPSAESRSAPVGGQIVVAQPVAPDPVRTEAGAVAGMIAAPPAPTPAASARPDVTTDGVVLPQAALRPGGPGYRIQLGVFGDAGNALKLYEQVAAQGYDGYIQSRVMVGPFTDRAAAEKARQALRRAGVGPGVLVTPDQSK